MWIKINIIHLSTIKQAIKLNAITSARTFNLSICHSKYLIKRQESTMWMCLPEMFYILEI